MQSFIRSLWILCLPASFMLAGIGMLWLTTTLDPELNFYQRIIANENAWIGCHVVLLISTILFVPGVMSLWHAVAGRRGTTLAGLGLLLAIPAIFFLTGQYAIDFVIPLVAHTGEPAYPVHRGLFDTQPINAMFYGIPDLAFIGMLLMTLALALSRRLSGLNLIALGIFWAGVIGGNILDQLWVARGSLLLLGIAFIPLAVQLLGERRTMRY